MSSPRASGKVSRNDLSIYVLNSFSEPFCSSLPFAYDKISHFIKCHEFYRVYFVRVRVVLSIVFSPVDLAELVFLVISEILRIPKVKHVFKRQDFIYSQFLAERSLERGFVGFAFSNMSRRRNIQPTPPELLHRPPLEEIFSIFPLNHSDDRCVKFGGDSKMQFLSWF